MLRKSLLVQDGYFPKELPPPFTTAYYGAFIGRASSELDRLIEKPQKFHTHKLDYNLLRTGALRRTLGIVNPFSYYLLACQLELDWKQISKHCNKSKISFTKPRLNLDNPQERYISTQLSRKKLPEKRASVRRSARYILQADISTFYSSIYTHTIPWALSGKILSKQKQHDETLLGNLLDIYSRNSQDRQTVGIPIGPDSSHVIAEAILSVPQATTQAQQ